MIKGFNGEIFWKGPSNNRDLDRNHNHIQYVPKMKCPLRVTI